jgi:hypothetical protein
MNYGCCPMFAEKLNDSVRTSSVQCSESSSPSSPTNPYSYVFVPMASEERISKAFRCSAEYVFAPMDRREFMMLRDIYVTERWLLKHIVCKGEAVAD